MDDVRAVRAFVAVLRHGYRSICFIMNEIASDSHGELSRFKKRETTVSSGLDIFARPAGFSRMLHLYVDTEGQGYRAVPSRLITRTRYFSAERAQLIGRFQFHVDRAAIRPVSFPVAPALRIAGDKVVAPPLRILGKCTLFTRLHRGRSD